MISEVLIFKHVGFLSPLIQIIIISFLLVVSIYTQRKEYIRSGKTYGRFPWRITTFFSSIYEEIIFRGLILLGLISFLNPIISIALSSILFGLYHLKNYKYFKRNDLIYQVLYTGIIFGPIVCIITLWTGTIWIAVIVHYLHNLLIYEFRQTYKQFLSKI